MEELPSKQRQRLVDSFNRSDGPPFFVLSLKAGGTGLNLTLPLTSFTSTAGGTPPSKTRPPIARFGLDNNETSWYISLYVVEPSRRKSTQCSPKSLLLAGEVIDGAEMLLTEMSNEQILDFVKLDVHKALDT